MEKNNSIFTYIVLCVIFVDQISKYIIIKFFPNEIPIINGIFHIHFVKNTGAGFSLFNNIANSNTMLIFSTIFIIGLILINYEKIDNETYPFVALILGGAFGNLIDRIVHGFVVDFLDFKIWPIFNLADTSITMAGIFILFLLFRKK